ncbi:hypothetical protein TIFTF001_031198 [Ficus carica]|uniref:Cysteine proteinase inhibitor n=1 Tax=Ficus carica TaxID=3494 RepID=A0AA88DVX1_FICCA|nr:hypothetical protein TIFTF001_031198 [Ficus carica]
METIADSSHVVYDCGHSSESNINSKSESKQVCELFEKICSVEEKNPLAQGFEPDIVNCSKSSEQTGDPKAPIENIFVRMFKAGGLDWVGAAVPCRKSEKDVQVAARFAVEEYNKIEGHHLELKEVVEVKWRITTGTLYYLTLECTNGCFFEAEVTLQPRDPPILLLFRHLKDYAKGC